jgi:four helix bundle protein
MMTSESIPTWKQLEVWKLAHENVLRTYKLLEAFPRKEERRIVDQLSRSIVSVPTNIAEGKGRSTVGEFLQFLNFARGSNEESMYLLYLSRDLGYIAADVYDEMHNRIQTVSKMLAGLSKSLRRFRPKK